MFGILQVNPNIPSFDFGALEVCSHTNLTALGLQINLAFLPFYLESVISDVIQQLRET